MDSQRISSQLTVHSGEETVSSAFWVSATTKLRKEDLEDILLTYNYLRNKLNDVESHSCSRPRITKATSASLSHLDEAEHDVLRARIHHLQAAGYSFEQRLSDGDSPLVYCVESCFFDIGKNRHLASLPILLGLGVNVNATTDGDSNALHGLLWSLSFTEEDGQEARAIFENVVKLLISAGIDLHHRNYNGFTPSQTAYLLDLWKDWCRALKWSGVGIEQMLRAEADLPWESGWETDWSEEDYNCDEGHDNSDFEADDSFDEDYSSDGSGENVGLDENDSFDKTHDAAETHGSDERDKDNASVWSEDNELYYNGSGSKDPEDGTLSLLRARAWRRYSLPTSFRLPDTECPSGVQDTDSTTSK